MLQLTSRVAKILLENKKKVFDKILWYYRKNFKNSGVVLNSPFGPKWLIGLHYSALQVTNVPVKQWKLRSVKLSDYIALTKKFKKTLLPLNQPYLDAAYQDLCNVIKKASKRYSTQLPKQLYIVLRCKV